MYREVKRIWKSFFRNVISFSSLEMEIKIPLNFNAIVFARNSETVFTSE